LWKIYLKWIKFSELVDFGLYFCILLCLLSIIFVSAERILKDIFIIFLYKEMLNGTFKMQAFRCPSWRIPWPLVAQGRFITSQEEDCSRVVLIQVLFAASGFSLQQIDYSAMPVLVPGIVFYTNVNILLWSV